VISAAWFLVVFAAVVGVAGMAVSILSLGSRIADVRRCERCEKFFQQKSGDSHE
jgi:hypothetical protein